MVICGLLAAVLTLPVALSTWIELSPSNPPAARSSHSAVWDSGSSQMLVFAGNGDGVLNDLQAYDSSKNSWAEITAGQGYGGRTATFQHAAAFKSSTREMFIMGGSDNSKQPAEHYSDMWGYNPAWSQWIDEFVRFSDPRYAASLVYNSNNETLILFGGVDWNKNQVVSSLHTYSLEQPDWSTPSIQTTPTARQSHVAIWDSGGRKMLVFGGITGTSDSNGSPLSELWEYDYDQTAWNELTPGGTAPSARHGASAVWDQPSTSMFVFGGYDGSSYVSDLFQYESTANSWISLGIGASARAFHSAAWDGSLMYVFGGYNGEIGLNDLWTYRTSTTTTTQTLTSTVTSTRSSTSSTSSFTATVSSTSTSSIVTSTTTTSSVTSTITGTSTSSTSSATSSLTSTTTGTTSSTMTSSLTSSLTSTSSSTSVTSSSSRTHTTSSTSGTSTSSTSTRSSTQSSSSTTSTSSTATQTSTTSSTASLTTSSTTSSSSSTSSSTASSTSTSSTSTSSTSTSSLSFSSSSTSSSSTSSSSTSSLSTSTSSTSSSSTLSSSTSTSTLTRTWTDWDLTPEEFAALEQRRKEEAARALRQLAQTEESAVQQLVPTLQSSASAGVLNEVEVQTESGVVRLVAFAAEELTSDHNLSGVPGLESMLLPKEVVLQAAAGSSRPVVLSVTAVSEDLASAVQADDPRLLGGRAPAPGRRLASASSLRSRAISITLWGGAQKLEMGALAKPITLVIPVADENASCAYWDEAAAVWASDGLELVPGGPPGHIQCRTTHLTIFGGVLGTILSNIVAALACTTVGDLVSVAALTKLGEGQWLGTGPATVTLSFVALLLLVMCCAIRGDRKAAVAVPWSEREVALLRVKPKAEEVKEVPLAETEIVAPLQSIVQVHKELKKHRPCCQRLAAAGKDTLLWSVSVCFGTENEKDVLQDVVDAPVALVSNCISRLHTHRSGVCKESLKAMMAKGKLSRARSRASEGEVSTRRGSMAQRLRASVAHGWSVVNANIDQLKLILQSFQDRWDLHTQGIQAVEVFLSSSSCRRILMLFPALHPWRAVALFSMFTPHSIRVALLSMKLVSAAAANAVFFRSTATPVDADPQCAKPQDPLARIVQAFTVGLATALMGDVLIALLLMLQRQTVIEREEWTTAEIARQRRRWVCRRCFFWVVWIPHTCFCIFYVLVFLANVSHRDAQKWLECTGISLLQDCVLKPLIVASLLGIFASIALSCVSQVEDKVRTQWMHEDEQEVSQEQEQPSVAKRGESQSDFGSDSGPEDAIDVHSVKSEDHRAQDFCAVLPGAPQ